MKLVKFIGDLIADVSAFVFVTACVTVGIVLWLKFVLFLWEVL